MYKPKVYLAGKITKNWWRNEILSDGHSINTRTPGISTFNDNNEYYDMEYDAGDFIVTGPHSIGCDHQCFHSNGSNHAANNGYSSCGDICGVSSKDIFDACRHQIHKSNVIFAYIDDNDAYGTLFELGYANAMYKNIYIVYKNDEIAKNNWFISQSARKTYVLKGDMKLIDIFTEVLNTYNKK